MRISGGSWGTVGIMPVLFWVGVGAAAYADGAQTGDDRGPRPRRRGLSAARSHHQPGRPAGQTSTITDEDGSFRFGLLVGGRLHGGCDARGPGLEGARGSARRRERQKVDLTLGGATAETITVTSEAPLVNKLETSATRRSRARSPRTSASSAATCSPRSRCCPASSRAPRRASRAASWSRSTAALRRRTPGSSTASTPASPSRAAASRIFMPTTSLTEDPARDRRLLAPSTAAWSAA